MHLLPNLGDDAIVSATYTAMQLYLSATLLKALNAQKELFLLLSVFFLIPIFYRAQ